MRSEFTKTRSLSEAILRSSIPLLTSEKRNAKKKTYTEQQSITTATPNQKSAKISERRSEWKKQCAGCSTTKPEAGAGEGDSESRNLTKTEINFSVFFVPNSKLNRLPIGR